MDGRQGHRPRAVRDRGSRSRPRLPRHGPAPARAQALRSGSTRHDRSPGLWPLDAAGAAGRGQRGHAAIPGGGEVMAVTGFEITLRRPLAGSAPFGDVGPYEELKGRLRYAIDPSHAANRGVTDVALAPRNAAGLVEFSADLSLLVPVDRARASGRALIDVVNRGNTVSVPNFNHATRPAFTAGSDPNPPIDVGDGFLMRRGYVVASCGWQFDLPDVPGLIRLHGGEGREQGRPVHVRRAYAYGRSQTGRLLRTLVHYGLNDDERGDEAFDGVIANVAGAMRGEFNQRFGQNSKDRPWTMCHLEPFQVEPRGRLRVMYTNTSAEYHRGDASLVHTDPDGARDLEHGPSVPVYHFAGTEHGLGIWPPADTQPAPADPHGWVDRSQNLRGVVNYGRLLRACLINLDRWVTDGIAPPPSRHPRVADGTAVAPETLAKTFDAIPGARYPRRHARPLRQDYGADAEMRRITVAPPKSGAPYGTRVSAVDSDGNEVGGIVLPELAVPLATHTGWNLRHADIGGVDQLLVFAGATLPFAKTRRERAASGDPRPAIAERYGSRDDYLKRVRAAARALVEDGYLLEEDAETSLTFAARMWDAFA